MDGDSLTKKDQIAAEFKEYFFAHGMVDTIITEVVKNMHISKKTFYKYFPNGKQECLYYIFSLIAQESLQEITQNLIPIPNASDRLRSILEQIYQLVLPYVYGNKAQTEEDYLRENQIVGESYKITFEPLIKDTLIKGKEKGVFQFPDVDLLFEAISSLMQKSFSLIHRNQEDPKKEEEITQQTLMMIFKLLE